MKQMRKLNYVRKYEKYGYDMIQRELLLQCVTTLSNIVNTHLEYMYILSR